MGWEPEIEELKRRVELARQMVALACENEATRLRVKTSGMRP